MTEGSLDFIGSSCGDLYGPMEHLIGSSFQSSCDLVLILNDSSSYIYPDENLTILLIEWHRNHEGDEEYAERIAIGRMEEEAWERQNPQEKMIRLI
jgi:hypothetical protein